MKPSNFQLAQYLLPLKLGFENSANSLARRIILTLYPVTSSSRHRAIGNETTTLLFDHDGTLIDSETVHYDLWKDILHEYRVELSEDFYCEVMAGIPVKQNAVDLVEHFQLDVAPAVLADKKHKSISD